MLSRKQGSYKFAFKIYKKKGRFSAAFFVFFLALALGRTEL